MENLKLYKVAFDRQVFDIIAGYVTFDKNANRMVFKNEKINPNNGREYILIIASFPLDKSALLEVLKLEDVKKPNVINLNEARLMQ